MELSVEVLTREVLSSPAPIPEDIREAMHVCVKAVEEPPNSDCLDGDLHLCSTGGSFKPGLPLGVS